ncbi:TIM barrel protein [Planctomicrobium sp. SH668]|uniref:TIM barrel protein n=1 Tax=Planctomicrobium sp. SH668 TaxID=3448126 RepID=UPI003F5BB023
MISSAVTISLVEQARSGPFVFKDDLQGSIEQASQLGYHAVELFLPGPEAVPVQSLTSMLRASGQKVAAVGTGAGMLIHQLSLTDSDAARRKEAIDFVKGMIRFGGEFGAPAIIGSMQGRWTADVNRSTALKYLAEALSELGELAQQYSVPLIYEPLNRYETNLCVTQSQGASLLRDSQVQNVVLLADLFHMNIEEISLSQGIHDGGEYIGHLHFVDSNRRPAGGGHIDFSAVVTALKEIDYQGYASAEAFAWPDSLTAATKTMESYRKYFQV